MSIWYQNHPSKELQAGTFFHILWLFSNFFTNNSCFLPSFCYNLCYNVNRRVMVKYHDSVYARKSWSAVAFGPVFASLTRRLLPPVPEGGTSRTYGLRSIKKELWEEVQGENGDTDADGRQKQLSRVHGKHLTGILCHGTPACHRSGNADSDEA